MLQFALMNGNTVSNIIAADNKEETEQALGCVLIEFSSTQTVGIGYTYDPATNEFVPPEEEP